MELPNVPEAGRGAFPFSTSLAAQLISGTALKGTNMKGLHKSPESGFTCSRASLSKGAKW